MTCGPAQLLVLRPPYTRVHIEQTPLPRKGVRKDFSKKMGLC